MQTPAAAPGTLKVFVLQGDRAIHNLATRTVTDPVVEVRDANDLPVEGADVRFELPPSGAGGSFEGNQGVVTKRTNAQGQATAVLTLNQTPGPFTIKVTATHRNRTGQALIRQRNSTLATEGPVEKKRSKADLLKSWKFWAVVAGGVGAATAAVLATRGNGKSTPTPTTPTITISPGSPSFGGPR